MKKLESRAPAVSALLLALAAMVGCAGEGKETEQAVPVEIVQVEKTALEERLAADAILFPVAQSAIVPKISAPVEKFLVNRGSRVEKGQLLAVLENRDLAAAAEENKGAFTQAEAAYALTTRADLPEQMQKAELEAEAAKQALAAEQKVFDSRQDLFRQGALPRKELDQAGVDLTNARNQYDMAKRRLDSLTALGKEQTMKSAKGQLESAQGKYQGAQAELGYSEIRSPINGVITDRPLYPGEMATAGTPLLTVMDTSRVVARAHIPQQEAQVLKAGDKAEVTAAGAGKPIAGTVRLVSPALDANSTTVEIWVELKNPQGRLRPGSSVRLSMVVRSLANALAIPSAALLTAPDGSTSVMLAGDDGKAHQHAVKTGIRDGDRVEIVEGLKEGERIVGQGGYGLPDNRKITSAQPSPGGKG
ncbi:MAG: efflux RND transporter periplasmic adaptor subunit [Acidobacteria bacterium]|nr:efflux RND transporter periplasmic adaptor subunit [Acidobacteriota bacterium]